jgi:hypothetical protein
MSKSTAALSASRTETQPAVVSVSSAVSVTVRSQPPFAPAASAKATSLSPKYVSANVLGGSAARIRLLQRAPFGNENSIAPSRSGADSAQKDSRPAGEAMRSYTRAGGATGTSGDGRPAIKARLTEPTELVVDHAGNLYFSDVNQGRVRRIDRKGIITTVARVHAAAGLAIDPSGRNLAIASIEGYIFRMPLPSGPLERLAGNGTATVSGDGGPATQATLNGPHDVTYDAAGNLYIGGYGHVRRIDVATGVIDTAFAHDAFKVVAARDGTFYLLTGGPHGGRVTQVDAVGNVLRTIGSGRLSPHRASARIDRVGFLPSDVEPVAGAILVSETEPVPAIRRLAAGSSTLTTLVR